MTKITHFLVILVSTLFLLPGGVVAQDHVSPYGLESAGNWPRGEIQVANDWTDQVKVTLWTHEHERIGDSWMLEAGESAFLAVDDNRIKVRPSYKIKVGSDGGWVNLGDVGRFEGGVWYVNVREIWRATRQRDDRPNWEEEDVPDWR